MQPATDLTDRPSNLCVQIKWCCGIVMAVLDLYWCRIMKNVFSYWCWYRNIQNIQLQKLTSMSWSHEDTGSVWFYKSVYIRLLTRLESTSLHVSEYIRYCSFLWKWVSAAYDISMSLTNPCSFIPFRSLWIPSLEIRVFVYIHQYL